MENLNVVLLDSVNLVRLRVKKFFDNTGVNIYEASTALEFESILFKLKQSIDMVIMDIELQDGSGFEVLKRIRESNRHTSIIVLTSNSRRETFIRAMIEGATDYQLKPFDDIILKEKISSYINTAANPADDKIVFNLPSYIQSELIKSKKGKYNISIMMTTYFKPTEKISSELDREYLKVSSSMYNQLRTVIWDTDVMVRYGSQSFVGIFPFCSDDNVIKVKNKLEGKFNEFRNANEDLKNYFISNASVTFPLDGMEYTQLFTKLTERMKNSIMEIKAAEPAKV